MTASFSQSSKTPLLSAGQSRILALSFPRLPTDRIARRRWGLSWRSTGRPEAPLLVCAGRVKNAMQLTALEAPAEMIGLKAGQGVAEARAMHPALDVVQEDQAADRRLLEAMADWCDRYTPLVSLDGKNGLFLDITGCAHLFGGEAALLKDALHRLHHLGLDVRGAISSSPGLSWAMARFGNGGIVEPDEMEAVLTPLPVASLRLDEVTIAALQKLGLKQVGDIMTAARAPLTRRFGAQLLLRLDQALGLDEEPISPRRPVASLSAERRLVEPVQGEEDILALAGQLGETLKPGMEARGVGGRLFELMLFRVDGAVFRISAGASKPLREPKRIGALFAERIKAVHDDLDAGFGYEIVRLNVLQDEIFDGLQSDFTGASQSDQSLAAFVDQVSARLGEACVQAMELMESHVPERAVHLVPAGKAMGEKKNTSKETMSVSRGDRPLRLFRTPEPIETFATEVPDGPPIRFRWRRIAHDVKRAEGPERLAAEWWVDGADASPRDYFRVEDAAGHRFWLYRSGLYSGAGHPPRWYMHGLFA